MEAAFKPQVNDELDTQNFLKFEEVSKSFFVCLMHVSFFRYYQAACGRMWPGLVLQVARVCLCEWRKAPVCMWHKAPLCECEWHKAPMCVWERVTQSTCVYVAQSARVCEVCWGLYALSLAPFFFLFSEITRSCPACLWKWTVYVFSIIRILYLPFTPFNSFPQSDPAPARPGSGASRKVCTIYIS